MPVDLGQVLLEGLRQLVREPLQPPLARPCAFHGVLRHLLGREGSAQRVLLKSGQVIGLGLLVVREVHDGDILLLEKLQLQPIHLCLWPLLEYGCHDGLTLITLNNNCIESHLVEAIVGPPGLPSGILEIGDFMKLG